MSKRKKPGIEPGDSQPSAPKPTPALKRLRSKVALDLVDDAMPEKPKEPERESALDLAAQHANSVSRPRMRVTKTVWHWASKSCCDGINGQSMLMVRRSQVVGSATFALIAGGGTTRGQSFDEVLKGRAASSEADTRWRNLRADRATGANVLRNEAIVDSTPVVETNTQSYDDAFEDGVFTPLREFAKSKGIHLADFPGDDEALIHMSLENSRWRLKKARQGRLECSNLI